MKKQLNARTIISALLISALLFATGIWIGYSLNQEKLSVIERELINVNRDIENFQLQFLFFDILGESATCPLLTDTLTSINDRAYRIGTTLTTYGAADRIQDYNEYLRLKGEYSRLLVGYWLLANKLKGACAMNASTIIYFYAKDCRQCDDEGFILTYLKHKFNERLLIFALDADLPEPSVQALKQHYNITVYPSLIIDGRLYPGFHSEAELESILKL